MKIFLLLLLLHTNLQLKQCCFFVRELTILKLKVRLQGTFNKKDVGYFIFHLTIRLLMHIYYGLKGA